MRPIPLIRSAAFLPFVRFLEEIGTPVEKLWGRVGLSQRDLTDPDAPVPLLLGVRFTEDAARREGIEQLGLLVARKIGLHALGSRGRQIRRAKTLGEAIRGILSDQPTWNSGARFWISAEGAEVRLVQRSTWRTVPSRQADLFTLEVMLQVVRAAAGSEWLPRSADLQSQGPCSLPADDPLARIPIRPGQVGISFAFPRALMGRSLCWPTVPAAHDRPGEGSLHTPSLLPDDFIGSARQVVRMQIEAGRLHVAAAAEAAGASLRSFQRRLAESGVSFSQLADEVRFSIARRLLEDPAIKIIDVGFAAGYSDPAHFTRAFRRWTATSPLEYRRLSLLEADMRNSA